MTGAPKTRPRTSLMLIRQGIRMLLMTEAEIEVVGEASNGREALEQIAATVKNTADGAEQARALAITTEAAANRTGSTSAAAGAHVDGVRDSSNRIAEIVSVIEGISLLNALQYM